MFQATLKFGEPIDPTANYWLVLEGDWGGQIYLTIPWRLVGPDAQIDLLLTELDERAWGCNDGGGASAYLCTANEPGVSFADKVDGGMGGAPLTADLWLAGEFAKQTERMRTLLAL